MKDIKVDEELKEITQEFVVSRDSSPEDFLKTVNTILTPVGGMQGYSVTKDNYMTITTPNDIYSIPLYGLNAKITPKVKTRINDFIKLLECYCEKEGIPKINREAHMGNGKKPGFEHGSTKHHVRQVSSDPKFIDDYVVGYISGNVSSHKVQSFLRTEFGNISLEDYVTFEKDGNTTRINLKQFVNHISLALSRYANTKGIPDLEFSPEYIKSLKDENDKLVSENHFFKREVGQLSVQIEDLESQVKKAYDSNNKIRTYKTDSTNETLADDTSWNLRRLAIIQKKIKETGDSTIQSNIQRVFESISEKLINFSFSEGEVLSYHKAKEMIKKRSQIVDEKQYLDLMPNNTIKDAVISSWRNAEIEIKQFEGNLYNLPVQTEKKREKIQYIFPIRSDLECELRDYLFESIGELETTFDCQVLKGNTSNNYITLSISNSLDLKAVDSRLSEVFTQAGIKLDQFSSDKYNESIDKIVKEHDSFETQPTLEIEKDLLEVLQKRNHTYDSYVQGLMQCLKGVSEDEATGMASKLKTGEGYFKSLENVYVKYNFLLNELNPEAESLFEAIAGHSRLNAGSSNVVNVLTTLLVRNSMEKLIHNTDIIKEYGFKLGDVPLSYLNCGEDRLRSYLDSR
jgi:hypothetical protein